MILPSNLKVGFFAEGLRSFPRITLNIFQVLFRSGQFECIVCFIAAEKTSTYICIVYRPPPSPVNQLNTSVFLREWAEFLSQYTTSTAELIIVGDINIHLDNTTHPHTTDMMHTLQSCGLTRLRNLIQYQRGYLNCVL